MPPRWAPPSACIQSPWVLLAPALGHPEAHTDACCPALSLSSPEHPRPRWPPPASAVLAHRRPFCPNSYPNRSCTTPSTFPAPSPAKTAGEATGFSLAARPPLDEDHIAGLEIFSGLSVQTRGISVYIQYFLRVSLQKGFLLPFVFQLNLVKSITSHRKIHKKQTWFCCAQYNKDYNFL
jgi:hypothetical protein